MQVLIVNPPGQELPEGTRDVLGDFGWTVTSTADYRSAIDTARGGNVDAVILAEPDSSPSDTTTHAEYQRLLRLIDGQRIAGVVVSRRETENARSNGSLVDVVGRDVTTDELRGRLITIERYHGFVRRMEQELRNMERLSQRLNEHFREVDEEMRLAARLQRDFLPRVRDPIGPLRFATIFRPATWVSGDIYDIIRIDDRHTGFYVADAVGHGVSASLLTMFIKRAIVTRLVEGDQTIVLQPSEVIGRLNEALAEQSLPNCQFVTACYAVIDHETLRFRYARGGHPYPVIVSREDGAAELRTQGGLLGLFKEETFPDFETTLHRGDKIILYSDGIELALDEQTRRPDATIDYARVFEDLGQRPIQEMFRELDARFDDQAGSLDPKDDITLVGVEIL